MSEKTWSTMNGAMGAVQVTAGLNALMTIDGRSYHMTSPNGRMQIEPISTEEVARLGPTVQCRIKLSHDAFVEELERFPNVGNMTGMMDNRKVQIEGDMSVFAAVQRDMAANNHISDVQAQMEAVGAHSEDVKEATKYHLSRLEAEKAEREEEKAHNQLDFYDLSMWGFNSEANMPLLQKMSSWLLFSAGSTMMGNVGQANYCAANALLDAMTFSQKQSGPSDFDALTLMWGAVAGLGMRWKAFASQDFLLQAENSAEIMMDYKEAGQVLKFMCCGIAPEWANASKMDEPSRQWMVAPSFMIVNQGAYDPWGFKKGKGGGELSADRPWEEDTGPEASSEAVPAAGRQQLRAHSRERLRQRQQAKPSGTRIRQDRSKNAWLFEGRRVQIYGLERSGHMNGVKGTLLEEVEDGKWQVRLDGDHGEKLVRIQNLMTLTGKPLMEFAGGTGDHEQEPARPMEQYCIAGTWDDWLPHDMHWDASELCFLFEVEKPAHIEASFAICRGKAGERKWKTRGQNNWVIPKERLRSHYNVKLFLNAGGSVKKVDWAKIDKAVGPAGG